MRAVLILAVMLAWMVCLVGGAMLTVYLLALATAGARDRYRGVDRSPSPPAPGVVAALVVFAVLMFAAAAVLTGLELWRSPDPSAGRAVAWAGLPAWAALVASLTAVVLIRRGPGRPVPAEHTELAEPQ